MTVRQEESTEGGLLVNMAAEEDQIQILAGARRLGSLLTDLAELKASGGLASHLA